MKAAVIGHRVAASQQVRRFPMMPRFVAKRRVWFDSMLKPPS